MDAIAVFEGSIDRKSTGIDEACRNREMETYINLVHSLKSTSRAVGANELSELAFTLEQAGKNGDTGLMDNKTPELLALYRSLKKPFDELLDAWDED